MNQCLIRGLFLLCKGNCVPATTKKGWRKDGSIQNPYYMCTTKGFLPLLQRTRCTALSDFSTLFDAQIKHIVFHVMSTYYRTKLTLYVHVHLCIIIYTSVSRCLDFNSMPSPPPPPLHPRKQNADHYLYCNCSAAALRYLHVYMILSCACLTCT